MRHYIFIAFLLCAVSAFAQQTKPERPLVQFSGVVINADSSTVVPYVTVTNIAYHNQAVLANYKGYFSFVVHELDTVRFTSIGYAQTIVVVPADVKNKSYTLKVKLKAESIRLPVVHVFPWATTDEFHKDFMSMKIADDELEIARKNLSGKSIASLERTVSRDPGEMRSFQDMHNAILNQHSLPPNPLLNPFAWGSLIKEITAGDKSRASDSN